MVQCEICIFMEGSEKEGEPQRTVDKRVGMCYSYCVKRGINFSYSQQGSGLKGVECSF